MRLNLLCLTKGIALIYQSPTASTPVPGVGPQSQNHNQGSPVPKTSLWLSVPPIMQRWGTTTCSAMRWTFCRRTRVVFYAVGMLRVV